MDERTIVATRRALHGVAELLIAGPQLRAAGTIRMRVTPGGFGGIDGVARVEGADLVVDGRRCALDGTAAEIATTLGIAVGVPEGVYKDSSGVGPDDPLDVDTGAAELLSTWFATGETAARQVFDDVEPVLWPEHFDLAVTVAGTHFGVSAGDQFHQLPYAYVSTPNRPAGPFWNAAFGALRPAAGVEDVGAVAGFFEAGRRALG